MTTGSLLYAISTKHFGSTYMQCTIKDEMGPLYILLNDMASEVVNTCLFASPQAREGLSLQDSFFFKQDCVLH